MVTFQFQFVLVFFYKNRSDISKNLHLKTCAKSCNIDYWRWRLLMPGRKKQMSPPSRGQDERTKSWSSSLQSVALCPSSSSSSYFCSLKKKKNKKAIGRKESRVADLRALSGTRGRDEVYLQSSTPLLLVAQSCFPARLEASWRD